MPRLETTLQANDKLDSTARKQRGLFHASGNGASASADAESIPEGVLLCGKYHVVRKIGQGPVAGIWLVRHSVLDIERALKRVPAHLAVDRRIRDRFERKARIMALIDHPAAVGAYDCGISDGAPYLEMEYVQGRNYEELLASCHPSSIRDIEDWLLQLCDLLEHAHSLGIVHRDLKTNKLVRQDWKPAGRNLKVLGFGMATVSQDAALVDNDLLFIGTPAFASPEQILMGVGKAQGDPVDSLEVVDARSDIYSVGVVLYKALTGVLPYRGGLDSILLQKINRPPPRFDPNLSAEVPAELEQLVLRCLARSPADRPSSAKELREEFQKAIRAGVKVSEPAAVETPKDPEERLTAHLESYANAQASAPCPLPTGPAPDGEEEPSYTLDEAALVLGLPIEELERLVEHGECSALRDNDHWRIPAREVDGVVSDAYSDGDPIQDHEYSRLSEEIRRDSYNSSLYRRRGDLALKHRRYERAIADYTKAIRLDLRSPEAFKKRAFAYRFLGEFDRAIQDYSAALTLSPRDASGYLNRGFAHHARGDFDRAVTDYTRAIELDPNEAAAYYNRGLAFRARGQEIQAIADYSKVIELYPSDTSAHINRGFAYRLKGDHDRAIADYSRAIQIEPRNVIAYVNRGVVHISRGEYDQAIADFDIAVKLDEKNPHARYNRGFARLCKGDCAEAANDFTQALTLSPNDAATHYNRAYACQTQGLIQQAIHDYTRAIQLGGREAAAFYNRGIAFRDLGDHQQAIVDFTQAIRMHPLDVQAILGRGIAHQALKEFDYAIADFSEAIRLDRDDPIPYLHRGQIHQSREDYDQAIADYSDAIRVDPRVVAAYRCRAFAYLRSGHKVRFFWDLSRSILQRGKRDAMPRRLRMTRLRLPEGLAAASAPRS